MHDLPMEGVKCDQGVMPQTPKSSYTDHYIVYKYKPLKLLVTPFILYFLHSQNANLSNYVMIIRVSAERDVIFVGRFFEGKTPEIIHPLPIMGKNLLILSN